MFSLARRDLHPRLTPLLARTLLLLSVFNLSACLSQSSDVEIAVGAGGGMIDCMSQVICEGPVAVRCAALPNEVRADCSLQDQRCFTGIGCLSCSPGELLCDGLNLTRCSVDGLSTEVVETCAEGCERAECIKLCDEAALSSSYFGCEYWPTPIQNLVAKRFSYAVAVVNPQSIPAEVSVTRGSTPITARTVAPGAVEIIKLDWIEELSSPSSEEVFYSSKVPNAAYRLLTSVPVTVYQFNPLEYELPEDCPESMSDTAGDEICNSFTNDASLLLPTHTFGQSYLVMTYGSIGFSTGPTTFTLPSSFQVVGVAPEPTEVTLTFSSSVMASADNQVSAYQQGETGSFTLNQGEVLQIMGQQMNSCSNPLPGRDRNYCGDDPRYDLSGTLVRSNQPVQVFGSHLCANVPYQFPACDHLEESLFPVQSWGKSAVVPATRSLNNEPNLVRVFSSSDDNLIQFSPEVHPSVTLNAGQWVEFESAQSFRVTGTQGIQVVQFLVAQLYDWMMPSDDIEAYGDPSMSLVPPEDQYRTNYTFLAPSSYAKHFVSIVAKPGQQVTLDGVAVQGLVEIPGTGWASVQVELEAGAHSATSAESFGVWVYGFGSFTSYFYPGGLDLRVINDVSY